MTALPRLYAILDASGFPESESLLKAAEELISAGVALIQYRNKLGDAREILDHARALRKALTRTRLSAPHKLIMNDRADLCIAAQFDGVHVGQDDLSPESARRIVGEARWLGISTHNAEQVIAADDSPADYVAIGPVFETGSKANPDPVVGLDGVRKARSLTR